MYKKISYFIATMFGVGYCPFASGTAGSLATIPFAFAAVYYGGMVGVLTTTAIVFFYRDGGNARSVKVYQTRSFHCGY